VRHKGILSTLGISPARRAALFGRREDGSMLVFGLIVFVLILLVAGLAVDFMRYENNRMRVQATADRAVLAAATLREVGDREAIVRDYFQAAGLLDYLDSVEVVDALNASSVTVNANVGVNTLFMRWVGTDQLVTREVSTAREEITNIEIAMVLDISGSMRWTDSIGIPRITRLRSAALEFVDRVINEDTPGTTTISIVPYAGTVNPGQEVFELLGGQAWHDYSHCPDLPRSTFDNTDLPNVQFMPQAPHFMHWAMSWATMDWGWCPNESNSILYHSGDVDELQTYLTEMRLHDGTGTHYGMRWGISLLDPTSRWLTQALADSGTVAQEHADRPADWDDPETMKVIVLMTDGMITDQFRPRRAGSSIFGRDGVYPTEEEQETLNTTHILSLDSDRRERITTRNQNVDDFFRACDMAKDNGVILYTIAFETNTQGQNEMRDCASSPSHYFSAIGMDLDSAFRAIAASIQSLRLTL